MTFTAPEDLILVRVCGTATYSVQTSAEPTSAGDWQSGGTVPDGIYENVLIHANFFSGQERAGGDINFPLEAGGAIFVVFDSQGFVQLTFEQVSAVI